MQSSNENFINMIESSISSDYSAPPFLMKDTEIKIIEILKEGKPLRAKNIAKKLGVDRRTVNHCLYTSLKHLVSQDNQYRWTIQNNGNDDIEKQLSFLAEDQNQNSSLDEILAQHNLVQKEKSLKHTLASLLQSVEEKYDVR